jgi:hypothetical protein
MTYSLLSSIALALFPVLLERRELVSDLTEELDGFCFPTRCLLRDVIAALRSGDLASVNTDDHDHALSIMGDTYAHDQDHEGQERLKATRKAIRAS